MPVSDAPETPETPKVIRRRDLLTGLAAGVAGAVVAPDLSAHTHTHAVESEASQAARTSQPAPAPVLPRFLDDNRRAMLIGIAEQIMPGARAAGVGALLDRVLAVESASAQGRFRNALFAFDHEARARHGKGWMEITGAQQTEILRAASTQASAKPVSPPWTPGQPIDVPDGPPDPPANLRDHFDHLKDWVQRAYLTTPVGMKEYGFTADMAFERFPGCTHKGDTHS